MAGWRLELARGELERMRLNDEVFGKRVRARFGVGGYLPSGDGIIIAYTTEPTIIIQRDDGSQLQWVAHLVEEDTRPDDFEPLLGPLYG